MPPTCFPPTCFLKTPSDWDSQVFNCCAQVISVVRGLVKRGITICATIHCPPPHTFTLFDRALIMQRGRVVYFGLNGQPAIDYFYSHFDKVTGTSPSPYLSFSYS